jgi:hypothetical protein
MKKIFLVLLLLKVTSAVNAQTKKDSTLVKKQLTIPVKPQLVQQTATPQVSMTPPPSQTTAQGTIYVPPTTTTTTPPPTTNAIDDSKYFLSAATVIIKTGNDNKEVSSNCNITINANDPAANFFEFRPTMSLNDFEFGVNSSKEIKLEYKKVLPNVVNPSKNSLQLYKQWGLVVGIYYSSYYNLDAWKIEGITVKLEFKDINGNPYPNATYANVTMGIQVPLLMGFKVGNDPFSSKDNVCNVFLTSNGLTGFSVNKIKTTKCPK